MVFLLFPFTLLRRPVRRDRSAERDALPRPQALDSARERQGGEAARAPPRPRRGSGGQAARGQGPGAGDARRAPGGKGGGQGVLSPPIEPPRGWHAAEEEDTRVRAP